jgi:HD-GYP domain-containing protein (c-di-GMP phosphodiesterase class II)
VEKKGIVHQDNIIGLIQRTLNELDPRLVNHGLRVAYVVSSMLKEEGSFTEKEIQDLCITAMMHDVGAYKTEDLEEMLDFETMDIWAHSIYGYLFLKHLSPLSDWAEVILYHHASLKEMPQLPGKVHKAAQILSLADRVEHCHTHMEFPLLDDAFRDTLSIYLRRATGQLFEEETVACFWKAEKKYQLIHKIRTAKFTPEDVFPQVLMTQEECMEYLKMLVYAIDFRSYYTVSHTITAAAATIFLAQKIGIRESRIERMYYGTLIHDLGKIGIPISILEGEHELTSEEMRIMRMHVDITEKILGDSIAKDVVRMAVRHHEKLDGSGYPRGLFGDALSLEEQIIAIADIISALAGTRSYKEGYSKEKTISILQDMTHQGKINARVVRIAVKDFDEMMEKIEKECQAVQAKYEAVHAEYEERMLPYKREKDEDE